jgi:hypothetical protein
MNATYNPTITQNSTWEVYITITKPDGSAFSLVDFTGKSSIKSDYDGTVLASPVVTVENAAGGVLKVFLSAAQSASLHPTSTAKPPKPGLPVWDVLIGNSDASKIYRVASGRVTIEPGVTQWTQ